MWKNKRHEFDEYAKIWNDKRDYVLYGAGNLGKEFFDKFSEKINIVGFCDSDQEKIGTIFCGREVHVLDQYKKCKIIVTSRYYGEIKKMLSANGLQENIDFTLEQLFECVFSFYMYHKLVFREFDISITSYCTLSCEYCNMQMRKFYSKEFFQIEAIKREVDIYFQWVDDVQYLGVLGGEPFLHPQLCEILRYIAANYRKRIRTLEVLTNGTCMPTEEFWELCKEYNISIQLSDYSKGLPVIKRKIEKFTEEIEKRHITCNVIRYDNWLDFGLNEDLNESEEQLEAKFSACNNPWRSVYQDKFYYCHLQTSAYRAGITDVDEEDFFDLSNYSEGRKVELLEFNLRKNERGYLSFCRVCRGCSDVNDKYVAPAIQVIKEGEL